LDLQQQPAAKQAEETLVRAEYRKEKEKRSDQQEPVPDPDSDPQKAKTEE
jgi:hypothetical protein